MDNLNMHKSIATRSRSMAKRDLHKAVRRLRRRVPLSHVDGWFRHVRGIAQVD
jgi:hypothetical protein